MKVNVDRRRLMIGLSGLLAASCVSSSAEAAEEVYLVKGPDDSFYRLTKDQMSRLRKTEAPVDGEKCLAIYGNGAELTVSLAKLETYKLPRKQTLELKEYLAKYPSASSLKGPVVRDLELALADNTTVHLMSASIGAAVGSLGICK